MQCSAIRTFVVLWLIGWTSVAFSADLPESSSRDRSEGWASAAATALSCQLESSWLSRLSGTRGRVTVDQGAWTRVSMGRAGGIESGDLLQVAYTEAIITPQRCTFRTAPAATLWVLRVEEDEMVAKVVQRNVSTSLCDEKLRVLPVRNQRWPLMVSRENQRGRLGYPAGTLLSDLAAEMQGRLERSRVFSLVSSKALPRESLPLRKGTILIGEGNQVYVNLNKFDGIQIADRLSVSYCGTSKSPKGGLTCDWQLASVLQVIRVDPTGSLCFLTQGFNPGELDQPTMSMRVACDLGGHVQLGPNRAPSSPSDSASIENQDGGSGMPEDSAHSIPMVQLRFMDSEKIFSEIRILATIVQPGSVSPLAQAEILLDSETLRPVTRVTLLARQTEQLAADACRRQAAVSKARNPRHRSKNAM